jgi:hypothetical protein
VIDPDQRNITDQRYADDAELRYRAGNPRPRTHAQWLTYFGEHYGDRYKVVTPSAPGGRWQAIALSGEHDELFGWSPTELLDELIEHRCRNDRTAMRQNAPDPHDHDQGCSGPAPAADPQSAPRQAGGVPR